MANSSASTPIGVGEVLQLVNAGGWEIVWNSWAIDEGFRCRPITAIEFHPHGTSPVFSLEFEGDGELWAPTVSEVDVAVLRTVNGAPTRIKLRGPGIDYRPRSKAAIARLVERQRERNRNRAKPLMHGGGGSVGPSPTLPEGDLRFHPRLYGAVGIIGNVLVLRHRENFEDAQRPYAP